jgi:hypothetical protein
MKIIYFVLVSVRTNHIAEKLNIVLKWKCELLYCLSFETRDRGHFLGLKLAGNPPVMCLRVCDVSVAGYFGIYSVKCARTRSKRTKVRITICV